MDDSRDRWRAALAGRAGGEIVLTGAGTSRHAAELAAGWWRELGLAARAEPATGFDPATGRAPSVVAITQSGATGSVLRLLEGAARAGAFRVLVTNTPGSPAGRRADLEIVTPAGRERAVPATRSFTSALLALRALGHVWAGAPREEADPVAAAAPALLRAGIAAETRVIRFVTRVRARGPWFFLGGPGLRPMAREGALKMLETAVTPAMELPAGELAHGPAALLGETTPVVLLSAAAAPGPAETRSLEAARDAGAPVLRVASGIPGPSGGGRLDLAPPASLPTGPASLAFFAAPILQLLALRAGERLGRDVDRPPRLGKAVRDD